MDEKRYKSWFLGISFIMILVVAFAASAIYINTLVFNDSQKITNTELPIAFDSLSMLEEFGDMTSNLLEYSHGEKEEQEEFYENLEEYQGFFANLKKTDKQFNAKLPIKRIERLTSRYIKSAKIIFESYDPESELWALKEVDRIEHGIARELELYVENIKNNIENNQQQVYLLELIDEAGDMLGTLAEYVTGEEDEVEEFQNNAQEFNFYLDQLKTKGFNQKHIQKIEQMYNSFYNLSQKIFTTYNPTQKAKILKLIDQLEHNEFQQLENILDILANNAIVKKEEAIVNISKTVSISKYISFFMAFLTISIAVFILRLLFKGITEYVKQMKAKEDEIVTINQGLEEKINERTQEYNVAKQEAEKASHAKSEFLSNMSHEIRTPMNSIVGFTEILLKSNLPEKEKKFVQTIKSSGASLITLINDILDFSKIEAGKLSLNKEPTNVNDLIIDAKNALYPKVKEKGLEFKVTSNNDSPDLLYIDKARLRQILFNLIGNAIKFTSQGGIHINIQYLLNDHNNIDLHITIIDTGIGISQENQNKIFTPFEQQSNSITKNYGGTGLGLAICKKLIELMKGKISVQSTVGEGSTFSVELKNVKVAKIKIETDLSLQHLPINYNNLKMLIVDDVQDNLDLITSYFDAESIHFFEAHNGEEAIELMNKEVPDLILMDLKMPIMDGYTACEHIRKGLIKPDVPIIAVSASVLDRDKEKLDKYFNAYVSKPIDFKQLEIKISELINVKSIDDAQETENLNEIKLPNNINVLFTNELQAQLDLALKTNGINDVKVFSEMLIRFSQDKNHTELLQWAQALYEANESFEVDITSRMLQELRRSI